ncbi:MAG: 50S ribosomal protein L1, partial [Thermoguttaceae bacterium]
MGKVSKRMKAMEAKLPKTNAPMALADAVSLLKEFNTTKFDQSVEISMRLGVDPKQSDQIVRGSVVLPNGIGKTLRVLVFAKNAKVDEATAAGADYVGGPELAEKIKNGVPYSMRLRSQG